MRSRIAAAAALVITGAGLLTPTPATADEPRGPARSAAPGGHAGPGAPVASRRALAAADRAVSGRSLPTDPSTTVAMRDLWLARPSLSGTEGHRADVLLARPTDGISDPAGSGYSVPAQATCGARVCVHHVPTTADAPPSKAWVDSTLSVMEDTWTKVVDGLGYRPPIADGSRGGDARFDVYLKDLGRGFYGYCTTEGRPIGRSARGYCVLDNDFSPSQFPNGTPLGNLRVTAAHEFFHAVQFAYDAGEDRWMMESTATWMEERVTSDVNDNRQYLPASQLYRSATPLDSFSQTGAAQYGNWIFWEYLSTKYGVRIVRWAWNKAEGRTYSLPVLRRITRRHGGLKKVYAAFASNSQLPGRTYPEGSAYPHPRPDRRAKLTRQRRHATRKLTLDHLTSGTVRLRPGRGLAGRRWKVRVHVDGPARRTAPAARVLVKLKNGRIQRRHVKLDRRGDGARTVTFSKRRVRWVGVTVANVSTRYRCHRNTWSACNGVARDDDQRFVVRAHVRR